MVGGGILGVAIAREVVRRRPGTEVVVLEKEDRLAAHQTGHNSGVVHAGIYYRPGSLKAELCTRGRALMKDFCAEHAIPYVEWRGKQNLVSGSRDGTIRVWDVPSMQLPSSAELAQRIDAATSARIDIDRPTTGPRRGT